MLNPLLKSALALGLVWLTGCTAVQVQPLASAPAQMCIEENPKVQVSDFVPVMREGFSRHGIATQLYRQPLPAECEYVINYTARRSWDVVTYLSVAEINIQDAQRRTVASANYHLRGKGGLSMMKWQSTKTKMDPVIDQLLANVRLQQATQPQASTGVTATAEQPAGMSVDQQIQALQQEKLDYAEYQRRYQQIMQRAGQ